VPDETVPPAAPPVAPEAPAVAAPAVAAPPAAPKRVNPYAASAKPAAPAPSAPAPAAPASNREALKSAKLARQYEAELASLKPVAAEAKEDRAALKDFADAQLAALPPAWQEHVRETAGESPRAQLKAITSLQKKGLLAAPAAAPAAKPAGATTAPPASPKAADVADADVAAFNRWAAAQKAGQKQTAAAMYARHAAQIEAGRKKSATAN
jgi:hypothetical protein